MIVAARRKRGDALAYPIEISDEDGAVLSPDPSALRSQIRTTAGRLLATLAISRATDPDTGAVIPGRYILSVPGSTQSWPTGQHESDVELYLDDSGKPTSSEIYAVIIEKDVTRDGDD